MQLHRITDKLGDAAEFFAGWLPDALMVGGAVSIAWGAGQVYAPAGAIVAGLFALAAGIVLSRGTK